MIGYKYDANDITGIQLKNSKAKTLSTAWNTLNDIYTKAGVKPKVWVLDNEISQEFKKALTAQQTDFQLVPPKTHRSNAAEHAVDTWKNHFLSELSCVDPNFLIKEWDRLIPQATLTLNLLRVSRLQPKISAHAFLHGNCDYNK